VGQAWANWLELMLRRYVGSRIFVAPQQISGEMIWKKARQMFYKGDLTGGLELPEGFEAMKELGFIPDDSMLMNIKPDWNSVGFALLSTPIVQAHHIHSGWANPDPVNGCIDHSGHPTTSDGYHATLRVGQIKQEGTPFYVSQNSWGMDWGWKGLFCMTSTEDAEGLMPDALYTANMPSGWTSWEGWKKGVIEC
jgi:hypothetical protein